MKLLLTEDDTNLREGLSQLLKMEGYSVYPAASGAEALIIARQYPIEFCLLDIMLPDTDGYLLSRALRQLHPKIPIMMLSAKDEDIDKILGFESGADDYLTKPFSTQELILRIRAIISRTQHTITAETPTAFVMQDLTIDERTLYARRDEHPIALSPRECKLLKLLHEHSNQVLSRDDIYNHCWGRQFVPSSRALDQFISALRQKIEQQPNEPKIIETVRGAGYRYPSPDINLTNP